MKCGLDSKDFDMHMEFRTAGAITRMQSTESVKPYSVGLRTLMNKVSVRCLI